MADSPSPAPLTDEELEAIRHRSHPKVRVELGRHSELWQVINSLFRTIDALKERVAELEPYVQHLPACRLLQWKGEGRVRCDCGLAALRGKEPTVADLNAEAAELEGYRPGPPPIPPEFRSTSRPRLRGKE